jgi:hypothetical protein
MRSTVSISISSSERRVFPSDNTCFPTELQHVLHIPLHLRLQLAFGAACHEWEEWFALCGGGANRRRKRRTQLDVV